jgi:hypothetical protein
MTHYVIYQPWSPHEEIIDEVRSREEALDLVEDYAFHGIDCIALTDPPPHRLYQWQHQ